MTKTEERKKLKALGADYALSELRGDGLTDWYRNECADVVEKELKALRRKTKGRNK